MQIETWQYFVVYTATENEIEWTGPFSLTAPKGMTAGQIAKRAIDSTYTLGHGASLIVCVSLKDVSAWEMFKVTVRMVREYAAERIVFDDATKLPAAKDLIDVQW